MTHFLKVAGGWIELSLAKEFRDSHSLYPMVYESPPSPQRMENSCLLEREISPKASIEITSRVISQREGCLLLIGRYLSFWEIKGCPRYAWQVVNIAKPFASKRCEQLGKIKWDHMWASSRPSLREAMQNLLEATGTWYYKYANYSQ